MESTGDPSEASPPSSPSSLSTEIFDRDRHVAFLEMMYNLLPSPYQIQEINRLTLAHFVVSGLDILGALDRVFRISYLSLVPLKVWQFNCIENMNFGSQLVWWIFYEPVILGFIRKIVIMRFIFSNLAKVLFELNFTAKSVELVDRLSICKFRFSLCIVGWREPAHIWLCWFTSNGNISILMACLVVVKMGK